MDEGKLLNLLLDQFYIEGNDLHWNYADGFTIGNILGEEVKNELVDIKLGIKSLSLNLSELDEDTLSNLCDQFRKNVFEKANKKDPRESNHIGFEYVQILSNGHDGMEGWINLFFNDEIVALINNDYLASQIKQSIPERH